MDPSRPEQERELESLYVAFAQANSLTTRQCMVLAVQAVKEGSYGLGGWGGLQGRLKALQLQGYVGINPATPGPGVQEANLLLDKLLSGCVAVRKEAMEQTYVDDEA